MSAPAEALNAVPFTGDDYTDWYKPSRAVDTLRLPDGTSVINPLTNQPLIMPAGASIEDNIATGEQMLNDYGTAVSALNTTDEARHRRQWTDAELARGLKMESLFWRGAPMEDQRMDGDFNETFTPFTSYNYGLVARAAGYSLGQALFAAGRYNRSSTGDKSGIYSNNPKNVPLIIQGWQQQPEFLRGDAGK